MELYEPAVGIAFRTSFDRMVARAAFCTSTTGVSPVTVTVSATAPTRRSALTVAVNAPVSSIPSRLVVLKPASVNVTEYSPGRRFSMRYWPVPSVTAARVFSIRAGLDASTVTPGSTAPELSFTIPAIDAWAYDALGRNRVIIRERRARETGTRETGNSVKNGRTRTSVFRGRLSIRKSRPRGKPTIERRKLARAVCSVNTQGLSV